MYVVRYTKVHKITQTYNKMTRINKYHQLLIRILNQGRHQQNKKGGITYLINEQLSLTPGDLLEIFETHGIARKNSRRSCHYIWPESATSSYRAAGIDWWDYCGQTLINSYPTYMAKLPVLIDRINREQRNSKNYVLFLGATEAPTNQAPCLSLIQHQIEEGELVISAYQRSSDASLGLPSDLYHLYLMSRQIELPLRSITLNLGNVHIYDTNIEATRRMLDGEEGVKYTLNV